MLSSFTSLLPSALQNISSNSHANLPPVVDDDDDEEDLDAKASQTASTKKKEKKEKGVNETFIFVRPPPAKTNHPLNLQVQLVPPNSHTPGVTGSSTITPRQSLDETEPAPAPSSPTSANSDTSGEPLARTSTAQSSRSEASSYSSSGYTSTASFSSVGSTASGRRMIIPLYNLQAHNVMTNTIVDAGTDAKIAKFTRKGLEMIDLAVMEVVEVWPAPSGVATSTNNGASTASARGSIDEGRRIQTRSSTIGSTPFRSRPTTPDPDRLTPGSSVVSVSSAGLSAADDHHLPENPYSVPTRLAPQKKNIFGKFFKKKDPTHSPDRTPTFPSATIVPPSPTSLIKTPIQTPTQSVIPPSPNSSSRHGRNLSSSMANFGKRGASASPSRPMTSTGGESTGLGIRGFVKHPRPSSMHLDPNDVQSRDYAFDQSEFGTKSQGMTTALSTTSSRISTASRMSNNNNLEPPTMSGSASSASNTIVLPATLGIQPTLSSPGGPSALSAFANFVSSGYPPPKSLGFGRGPALYVWVIRKWIKTPEGSNGTGLFGGMKDVLGSMGAGGSGSNMQAGRGMPMNIAGLSDDDAEGSTSHSRRQSVITSEASPIGSVSSLPATTSESTETRKKRNRLSTVSKASTNEDPDVTLTSIKLGRGRAKTQSAIEDDDGNDSDPEDSETPWTCTLKTRYLGVPGLPRSPSPSSPLKIKIATLSPMPHHPKVVAMLKIPYPLPDLEVQSMSIRKRPMGLPGAPLSPSGNTSSSSGLVFRAEEIKDVICSTGIWVVVREGFGGVGKVSRKGDGWRIRA
ncbi:hypothetical protein F5890DRAFT_1509829 [Lentinula detonsa]|uniref:Uncharacterized protein n=1 Tax=Lentinula detonsa TaxID=2804962 RepID=A0AA38Q140_9AGAR|nr:hypothetical protein F5890DRAFT_1509829 [Lentinula detonsa]